VSMAEKSRPNEEPDIIEELDPSGEHGRDAVEDVARKMHIDRQHTPSADDPTGEHDPAALQEVARKMGLER
jgi:hypothetical protein